MMTDPKDIAIHDLRNQTMNLMNELAFFRMDIVRLFDQLQRILESYPEKTEDKAMTAGGSNGSSV